MDSPPALRSLLDPRLVIVTGKGGTGKTTVAAALGLAGARAGLRTVVAEVGRSEEISQLFEPGAEPCGYAGRQLLPRLSAMRIDPYAALAEYLGLQLGVGSLANWVVDNRAFRQLMNAAPGWRELITLGKLWHLEQSRAADAQPAVDLIIVDAPATGHGLTFLDVPHVVVSAVRGGPLRRHSEQVEQLLLDPDRTLLLPVALPEELPVRETAELVARLRDKTGITVDRVLVNAVAPRPFGARSAELGDALDAIASQAPTDAGRLAADSALLAACLRHANARRALHESHIEELGRRTELPIVRLPLLPPADAGDLRSRLDVMADCLVPEPAA